MSGWGSVVASGQSRGVKFAVSPKNVEISSSNPDFGEAHEALSGWSGVM